MTSASSPTARRRQLGLQLRALREALGADQNQVAKQLGYDRSKIMRIEGGRSGISRSDLNALLDLYQVPADDARRSKWITWSGESRQRGWWVHYSPDERTSVYVGFETAATEVRSYNCHYLPGLFQTADYARSVLRDNLDLTADDIGRQVRLRQDRQARLHARYFKTWAIIDESVLHRPYPGRQAMYAQLMELAEFCRLDGVTVQVLPCGDSPPLVRGPFSILTLDDGDAIVHSEAALGDQWASDDQAVVDASLWFDKLRIHALSPMASRDVIHSAAQGVIDGPRVDDQQLQRFSLVRGSASNGGRY